METLRDVVSFMAFTLVALINGINTEEGCTSRQILEFGLPGVIQCDFSVNSYGIFWYNSTDVFNERSIIDIRGSVKGGEGYFSGEFDVYKNGSLLIFNVTFQHDHTFAVLKFNDPLDQPKPQFAYVTVVVKPSHPSPLVENCSNEEGICFINSYGDFQLNCSVQNSRPALNLTWYHRTHEGHRTMPARFNVHQRGSLYSSYSAVNIKTASADSLQVLLCKANSQTGLLRQTDTNVLIENKLKADSLPSRRIRETVKQHSTLILTCNDSNVDYLVWKKLNDETYNILAVGLFLEENITKILSDEVEMKELGYLVIPDINIHHEGFYYCVYSNGGYTSVTVYKLSIFVAPIPSYPIIGGCHQPYNCSLSLLEVGVLQCFLYGIRPAVQLHWWTPDQYSASMITFKNQRETIKQSGDTFDISITTDYITSGFPQNGIVVECRVTEKEPLMLNIKTSVTLTSPSGKSTGETVGASSAELFVIPLVSLTLIGAIVYIVIIFKVKQKTRRIEEHKTAELEPLSGDMESATANEDFVDSTGESRTIVLPTLAINLQDTASSFIKQLKTHYRTLYHEVRPLPYVQDHMICVDKVFVEGGVEMLPRGEGTLFRKWQSLDGYKCIFQKALQNSTRCIVEGEPGYGKTMHTLQIVFDWASDNPKTYMKDVQILVLLRLRLIGGEPSIFKAIRQFLLPKYSNLTDGDIRTLLETSQSVVIILDGYDEYPDQNKRIETDIKRIINNEMFQNFKVILTTRKSCLPLSYAADAARVRLTGFDEEAGSKYIRKAVVKDDETIVRNIQKHLRENQIISDLCQTPLFFVLFAHLTFQTKSYKTFTSVTNFFQFLIKCFHQHWRQKYLNNLKDRGNTLEEEHHSDLHKVAYLGLLYNQQIEWSIKEMHKNISEEIYMMYKDIGILVEENPSTSDLEDIHARNNDTKVRFYHKLFCEWYAANFIISSKSHSIKDMLKGLDPIEYQYVYRFVCGLRPQKIKEVVQYLRERRNGEQTVCLCLLEVKDDSFTAILKDICSNMICINNNDSRLLQRATIHFLNIAAKENIPIRFVVLYNSFDSLHKDKDTFVLKSGIHFPKLKFLRRLQISEFGRKITESEVHDIFLFASKCNLLRSLKFTYCLVPIQLDCKKSQSLSETLKVKWYPIEGKKYTLDKQTGQWQLGNTTKVLADQGYKEMVEKWERETVLENQK